MRYVATGRVLPERAAVHFPSIEWQIPNDGRVVAVGDSSQITVLLELASVDGWITAHVRAEHFAMIVVGALGFSLGSGYSVELIQVTEEDGTPHVFGVRPTGDVPTETLGFNPHDPVFNRAFQLSNRNVFFRLAIRDFLRAITDAIDCATYCYRAIESIKAAFVSQTGQDRWDDMHAALATDRNAIEAKIKRFADPVRHGNWVDAPTTTAQMRWEMLQLTRSILFKYLDHELPTT